MQKYLLFALSTVALLGPGKAEDPAIRKQLQVLYHEMSEGFLHGKIRPFEKILDQGYVLTKVDGKRVGRKEILATYRSQMKTMRDVRWPLTIKSLSAQGKSAVATIDSSWSALAPDTKGALHFLQMNSISREVWIKRADGWKLKSSEISKVHFMVDGRPVA